MSASAVRTSKGWEQTRKSGQDRFHADYELVVTRATLQCTPSSTSPRAATTTLWFEQSGAHDVGLSVWDGGVVLVKLIEAMVNGGELDFSGRTVVDVGAGTGIVGLACAALGAARVVLTDLPHTVLPLIERNVAHNQHVLTASCGECDVDVQPLDWTIPAHASALAERYDRIDYVLLGEVAYTEHLIEPLLTTLATLNDAHRPTILMSHGTHRISPLLHFFRVIRSSHTVSAIPLSRVAPNFRPAANTLFLKRLEPRSRETDGEALEAPSGGDVNAVRSAMERLSMLMERKASLLEQFGRLQWQMLENAALVSGEFERESSSSQIGGAVCESALCSLEHAPTQSAALLEKLGHAEWQCCESIAELTQAVSRAPPFTTRPHEDAVHVASTVQENAAPTLAKEVDVVKSVLSSMLEQRLAVPAASE